MLGDSRISNQPVNVHMKWSKMGQVVKNREGQCNPPGKARSSGARGTAAGCPAVGGGVTLGAV